MGERGAHTQRRILQAALEVFRVNGFHNTRVELIADAEPSDDLAADIIAYCRAQLAGFKCPRSVDFETALPRTEAGKLVKRQIRDSYWAEAGRQV